MLRLLYIILCGIMGLLVGATGLWAQSFTGLSFERLTAQEGLPSVAVTSLWQGRDGFLWVGTLDGLGRYDGYEVKAFRHDAGDSTTLSDNYLNIRALYEDQAGRLWIGTRQGLNRFDPATEQVRRYRHDPGDSLSLSHDNVLAIHKTRRGVLWIGTQEGLNRFDPTGDGFVSYHHDPQNIASLSTDGVTALVEDQEGHLWVGTRHGLNRYDPDNDRFTRYQRDTDALPGLTDDDVFSLHVDRAGFLWVGTWGGGLFRINSATEQVNAYSHNPDDPRSLPHDIVTAIAEDQRGRLWIGTWGDGLAQLDPETDTFVQYAHILGDGGSLADNRVTAILEDRTGVLWVGTYNGLNKKITPKQFVSYTYRANDELALSHPIVTQVYEDGDGIIWVGTGGGGLNRLDRANGTVTVYRHEPSDPNSLSHDEVTAIWEDDGALWVATLAGGLNRMDRATGVFTRYQYDSNDPTTNPGRDRIYAAYQDTEGRVWMATVFQGLVAFDPETERYQYYKHDPADPQSLSADIVWPLFEDHVGALWVGTLGGGLNRMDRTAGTFTRYRHDPDNPHSLSADRVLTITEDADSTLWIGTMGGGLNRFDRVTEYFRAYTTTDGLPHDDVACILPDHQGHLWIGTSGGLARFDLFSETFTNFNVADGLPSASFSVNACYKGARGEFFFGTTNGMIAFYPDSIVTNPHPPLAVLTGFELFNEPTTLDSSITHKQRITLPYNQNFIAFRYAALDFTMPSKNEYVYQLEGIDEDWILAGTRRYASYPNLVSGTYTFRVRASNNDGLWSEEGAAVQLIITPPWWKTGWAYGLYIMLLTLVGAGYVQWWISRLDNKRLEEHALRLADLDKAKSRFFANISHEFRTPLTLIMGPLKQALDGAYGPTGEPLRQQHEMMLRNSYRLQRLINQILDLAKVEAGSIAIKARPLDLVTFVRNCVQPFIPLAESEHITLTPPPKAAACIVYFDPECLEKVLANLLSNALKFTPPGGHVDISVQQRASVAEIAVRDTGPGMPEEKSAHIFNRFYQVDDTPTRRFEGSGLGLALTKDLVALHGGKITVESTMGLGSTFTIVLPLGKRHLAPSQILDEAPQSLPPASAEPATPSAGSAVLTESFAQKPDPEPHQETASQEEDITTVLVVDDNADVRSYVRSILEPTYRVLEAENGVRGLLFAQEALPDLILTDVMMPGMDGFALSRALKEDPKTDSIPVVFLTARAATEDELTGLKTGALDYITKPFEASVLRARLQSLIAFRKQLRERFSRPADAPAPETPHPAVTKHRSTFETKMRRLIESRLHDPDFKARDLIREMGMSATPFYMQFNEEISSERESPIKLKSYIRIMRLERAAELLLSEEKLGIPEVAYAVGFNSLSYFTSRFRKHFGMSPSDYRRSKGSSTIVKSPVSASGKLAQGRGASADTGKGSYKAPYCWDILIRFPGRNHNPAKEGYLIWSWGEAFESIDGVELEIVEWGTGSLWVKFKVWFKDSWSRDEVQQVLVYRRNPPSLTVVMCGGLCPDDPNNPFRFMREGCAKKRLWRWVERIHHLWWW